MTTNDVLHSDGPTDPNYETWKRKRIERAIADARANPDSDEPIKNVRAFFEEKFHADA